MPNHNPWKPNTILQDAFGGNVGPVRVPESDAEAERAYEAGRRAAAARRREFKVAIVVLIALTIAYVVFVSGAGFSATSGFEIAGLSGPRG